MALLLLNCSVDTVGIFIGSQESENIGYNHQESIIEIVVEQFLGFENAIPEHNNDDLEQQDAVKKTQLVDVFILPDVALSTKYFTLRSAKLATSERNTYFSKYFFKIPSPPPEV